MIIAVLLILGLCLGSFVNALVWRIHEQSKPKKKRAAPDGELSIATGRSMCPSCKYTLRPVDLIPVFSWLILKGKCRNCHEPIGVQYPVVELLTALLFAVSYGLWPLGFETTGLVQFVAWLLTLTAFMALSVYDLRWMVLPNRIVFPLGWLWVGVVLVVATIDSSTSHLVGAVLGALCGGGIFWVLYQVSDEKWIGGGDVKLGFVLGLIVASPLKALLIIFLASYIGTLIALSGMLTKKRSINRKIPFGPSLMIATIIIFLTGAQLISWYANTFLF